LENSTATIAVDKTYFNFPLVLLNMFAIMLLSARKYYILKRQSDTKEAAIIQFFPISLLSSLQIGETYWLGTL